ncbi:dTDP-4-dehydrorhamnose reductase [Oceanisphaera pacifica]|uniref:dTDP-4-dehydrorhamnose reductase n=1 Tax=Oceanisphaera pacifica TaxID=2818389 RepID=A0ABS3NGM4_9GAMM|nr:dTDP-4-dehydrorhamnose reductase [Oceanisphaera pacifica]MBO1519743.1 dTDP-4-dehydrorhamnose reductase [Oceanisphaera pacifica]
MHILLLGKNGQVGWELQRALAPLGTVTALDRHSIDYCGDVSQLEQLSRTISELKPDIIVNAAAYTAVDKAESDTELAQCINGDALAVLAKEAEALGAWLIHYSTDYVFNGSGNTPWQEQDTPAPLNVYGATKLAGEQAIQAHCSRYLILRTSWVYAGRGANFAKTMLRLAKERSELGVIEDQIGAPTSAELIADCTAHAIRTLVQHTAAPNELAGIYHLAASGQTSWHDYAAFVFTQARLQGETLSLTKLNAIASADYRTPAPRSLNSRLNTTKFSTAFNLVLPPWQQGVTRMLTEILEQK